MGTVTNQLVGELPPMQRVMLRGILHSLPAQEQARMEAALVYVATRLIGGDPRDFRLILQEWITKDGQ